MPPINFSALTHRDLDPKHDPTLAELNRKLEEMTTAINTLQGVHGPIKLMADLDLNGNNVTGLGSTKSTAVARDTADTLYGASTTQKAIEATGNKILQTTRRLGDNTQQHAVSGDLKLQGSIPPTVSGTLTYSALPTSIRWSWTALTITFADGTVQAIADSSLNITGLVASTTYFFYPYYDTMRGVVVFVADSVNAIGVPPVAFPTTNAAASLAQNFDGRVPLSIGAVSATAGTGHSGGGGGNGCIRGGMLVESRARGPVSIESINMGEEIRSRIGWTRVTYKKVGRDRTFLRIALSNGESLQVTPSHPLALFMGKDKAAGELCMGDLLVGLLPNGADVPLQIMEMSILHQAGYTVLLSCDPTHEYLVGSGLPCVVAHNTIPPK